MIEGPVMSPRYLNTENSNTGWMRNPEWLMYGSRNIPGRQGIVYRTGDLAQYRSDGTIAYLGRASAQVKLNGQRVELGEVEFHLRYNLPGLQEVVVDIVRVEGTPILCAFLRLDGQTESELVDQNSGRVLISEDLKLQVISPPTGLNAILSDIVPRYMIPSLYTAISYVPLTPTRKVDRKDW